MNDLSDAICAVCGQPFVSDVPQVRFCSSACFRAAGKPREGAIHPPNATCIMCGKDYWVQPSRRERSRFCSVPCQVAYRSEPAAKVVHTPNTLCEQCGESYWVKPSALATTRFCSRACQDAARSQRNAIQSGSISAEDLARLYYDQGLSMRAIADLYGCSLHRIVYWMDYHGLKRRSWSEATYLKRNPDGDPFTIRMPETSEEWLLFGLGIGLYMGEGTKGGGSVALANTNPSIHRVFLNFMETFCGVHRSQMHVGLNVYDDCDVDAVLHWWCTELDLSLDQFYKSTIRASRGGTQTKKSRVGTLSISFRNVKLAQIIADWSDEYYERFSGII